MSRSPGSDSRATAGTLDPASPQCCSEWFSLELTSVSCRLSAKASPSLWLPGMTRSQPVSRATGSR